jgi:transposase
MKRLEKDKFQWPETADNVVDIHGYELSWLLDGLTLEQHRAHRHLRYETVL